MSPYRSGTYLGQFDGERTGLLIGQTHGNGTTFGGQVGQLTQGTLTASAQWDGGKNGGRIIAGKQGAYAVGLYSGDGGLTASVRIVNPQGTNFIFARQGGENVKVNAGDWHDYALYL